MPKASSTPAPAFSNSNLSPPFFLPAQPTTSPIRSPSPMRLPPPIRSQRGNFLQTSNPPPNTRSGWIPSLTVLESPQFGRMTPPRLRRGPPGTRITPPGLLTIHPCPPRTKPSGAATLAGLRIQLTWRQFPLNQTRVWRPLRPFPGRTKLAGTAPRAPARQMIPVALPSLPRGRRMMWTTGPTRLPPTGSLPPRNPTPSH